MKKIYKAEIPQLENLLADAESFCEASGAGRETAFKLGLCLDEIFTNIANYGCEGGKTCFVEVELDAKDGKIFGKISDDAKKFNPLSEAAAPDLTSPVEKREIGGLGVYLVKKNLDSVEYKYENGKNVLSFHKKF